MPVAKSLNKPVSQRHSTKLVSVEQLVLPLRSSAARIVPFEYQVQRARECRSFGNSMEACAITAGLDCDKQVTIPLDFDPGQFSRWQSGQEGIKEHRLAQMMAHCGNDIPLLYLVESHGFDAASLRRRETALETENRTLREQLAAVKTLLIGRLGQ